MDTYTTSIIIYIIGIILCMIIRPIIMNDPCPMEIILQLIAGLFIGIFWPLLIIIVPIIKYKNKIDEGKKYD